jgi:hypothetical protein
MIYLRKKISDKGRTDKLNMEFFNHWKKISVVVSIDNAVALYPMWDEFYDVTIAIQLDLYE